ncbi:MAG TPA: hypothetical protein VN516_04990, partial [Candidatus Baltobacteraceae bacterium]|nr:hypothetical protein [Candidatus Baltobacteraceae bacterium]
RMGMSGDNAVLDKKRNEAMHSILGPVLQASINREAESKIAKISSDSLKESKAQLAVYGVLMS